MSKEWSYVSGDWWVICDVCGRKTKASEAKQRWDGFLVCSNDFETRHSLDFIRVRSDEISVPYTRPQGTDQFLSQCSTRSAIPGYATAGCMQPSNPHEPGIIPT